MAEEKICVFCGQRPGLFQTTDVQCGPTWQTACKACAKEVKDLSEIELCQRALRLGFAQDAQKLEQRVALISEAEDHRPKCLRCGKPMFYMETQTLDSSPMRDGLLSTTFSVLPAVCKACGRLEFYDPAIVRNDKHTAYLIWKDRNGG